jgi:CRISPR-associated protein Cas1
MVHRTVYIGNPAKLRLELQQMVVEQHVTGEVRNVPVEDIGLLVLDHPQIILTNALLSFLLENNVAVINCGDNHHPQGMFLPLEGNSMFSGVVRCQLEASKPLKKQLWRQTVQAKIYNQGALLKKHHLPWMTLKKYSDGVRTNDKTEVEGVAAAHYWKHLFKDEVEGFVRDRYGAPPNNLLNYGYAILRAITARALVSSGLLPVMGLHHRNQYNAYCLADDVMEPYRPYVDRIVKEVVAEYQYDMLHELDKEMKQRLLQIPTVEVLIEGERSPLMVAMHRTTASLSKCFSKEKRTVLYPELGPL